MDRKSLKLKIPSINHIFGQSIDQVEKFCLARAYTDYAFGFIMMFHHLSLMHLLVKRLPINLNL